ncbi:hypothetical protein [Streptomyces sp. NPDC101166]|uniref:hypothetical protein n=1 Tax=Streptomyces sp. NPDC101166 TaxID=3366120 RepID=UPI0037FDF7F3
MDSYDRLEDCDVGDDEPTMNSAEAMESIVLHRDCLTALCERKMAASQIIRVASERGQSAKVIQFPATRTESNRVPRDR